MSHPPSWRDDDPALAAPTGSTPSNDSTRRIANALVYYGVAGLVLAAIGLVILLVAASRLNGVTDRVEVAADRMLATLDRTADLLDAAVVTVDDVASTLDAADPMLDRVAGALTTTVASLRGLQEAAGAVSILGAQPLGGLANRFGQVADSLDGLDVELATFADDLASDAGSLRLNAESLAALAGELHRLHSELTGGLITDAFAATRFLFVALLLFLIGVAALPATAALWIGRRIRSEVGPAPTPV
jgi:hypothetical protein